MTSTAMEVWTGWCGEGNIGKERTIIKKFFFKKLANFKAFGR